MIANTRKMREIQQIIASIIEEESFLCDLFNGMVEEGTITEAKLRELSVVAKQTDLHKAEIERLTREDIMSNPYLSRINIPNISLNNFRLSKRRIIRPGTITKYKPRYRDLKTMRQVNSYFVCDQSLRFPGLVEGSKNTCWMSVEPCEIESFRSFIESATGNVLLIGCGLGYVAYMLSLKEDVTNITIVDNNQEVLTLFNKYILPQFEHQEKVQTVACDGLEYLKTADLSTFEHVNVDIWYDTADMIYPYLRCLEIEKQNPTVKFSYWLEDELKDDLQKNILIAATRPDCVEGKGEVKLQDNSPSNMLRCESLLSKIGKSLVEETKITNYEELYDLVNIQDLRGLLLGWYATHIDTVERQEPIDMQTIKNALNKDSTLKSAMSSRLGSKVYFK